MPTITITIITTVPLVTPTRRWSIRAIFMNASRPWIEIISGAHSRWESEALSEVGKPPSCFSSVSPCGIE